MRERPDLLSTSLPWHPSIDATKPGYRDLVQALDADLRAGRLAPGDKLPTHRELSAALGISRGTVARAFEEAQRLGLVRSGIGQGTFVADAYVVRARQQPISNLIEMGLGFPLSGLDPDPAPILRALAGDSKRFDLLQYPFPGGLPEQRIAGARWCSELGVPSDPDDLFIVMGAQHAAQLWLHLLQPGDTLLCAELTYRMVVAAAEARGIQVRGVTMDAYGILPDALDRVAEETAAKGLFVMPTLQNPTAILMPEERRGEIAAVAERRDLQILEDDIHGFFLPSPRLRPLKTYAPERVTYVASLSKTLAGGLRLAFAVPPPHLHPVYRSALLMSVNSAPPLTMELVARWMEDGTVMRVVEAKRREASQRLERLVEVLGPWVPEIRCGAYFAWISLPAPWTAGRLAMEARRRNVSIMPAEPFYVGKDRAPEAIRVSLGAVTREQMEEGLHILQDLLEHPRAARGFI